MYSLHVPKIIEFYLYIQMLPSKMELGLTLAGPPCTSLFIIQITNGSTNKIENRQAEKLN